MSGHFSFSPRCKVFISPSFSQFTITFHNSLFYPVSFIYSQISLQPSKFFLRSVSIFYPLTVSWSPIHSFPFSNSQYLLPVFLQRPRSSFPKVDVLITKALPFFCSFTSMSPFSQNLPSVLFIPQPLSY